jgi:hypothetical protein
VERFVIQQNIEHYRAMLEDTTDPEPRRAIEKCFSKKKLSSENTTTIRKRSNGTVDSVAPTMG